MSIKTFQWVDYLWDDQKSAALRDDLGTGFLGIGFRNFSKSHSGCCDVLNNHCPMVGQLFIDLQFPDFK